MATAYEWGRSGGATAGALYDGFDDDPFGLASQTGSSSHDGTAMKLGLDAARSSSLYGNSTTVQPPALRLLPCIKF